ncbi:MAG: aspartate aminotransferase family protein [Candidatus Bathyarchaeota archaeon]|nr:MAG: aspartate aminotransferase family protein [Candidatus Bathyarchaeota archaeon]
MSVQPSASNLFSRSSGKLLVITRGEGVYCWDREGRRYIDGSSGPVCVNIGHGVKDVAEAVAHQMEKISYAHSSRYTTESVLECAEKLARFAPPGLNRTYFCSGGSEATEAAAKLARQYHLEQGGGSRYKIIARWQSYHGNTLGALSMSGNIARRRRYVPLLLDFPHIPPAYCYRCPFGKNREACDIDCALALEAEIKTNGPQYISAFIAEPVVGATLGTVPAPEGYFQVIREICDRHGVLFIADEVMTGLGRTGRNWGIEHWGVEPDMITTAKGLAGGYMPLGACIVSDKIAEGFNGAFAHGHTYGSHPVACAVGAVVLDYIAEHKLVQRSAELGRYLHERLVKLYDHSTVGDVRGLGVFAGIEFVKDRTSKKPFPASVGFHRRVLEHCLSRGLLVYPGVATVDGFDGDHIQVAPPLVVTREQIDEIVSILDAAIGEAEREVL